MFSEKQTTRVSKFLSLVLRHRPELIGIHLDEGGWTDVDTLILQAARHGVPFDRAQLNHVVATNAKQRFAFHEHGDRIRASQGHSVEVELGYETAEPPEVLYHGTGEQSVAAILTTGLRKGSRQQVHLSSEVATAIQVGQRHGRPRVFLVQAGQMFRDGFAFFRSANGVWLTGEAPPQYLQLQPA